MVLAQDGTTPPLLLSKDLGGLRTRQYHWGIGAMETEGVYVSVVAGLVVLAIVVRKVLEARVPNHNEVA